MPSAHKIRYGDTEPRIFTLFGVDEVTNDRITVDLTGATFVDMRCRSLDEQTTVNFDTDGSQLEIYDAANGKVRFFPSGTDFLPAKKFYNAYFVVTDAAGYIVSFPSDGEIQLEIVESY